MKVLIVGCGYLGSALGATLAKKGAEVYGIRRHWAQTSEGIKHVTADLSDTETLKNLPETGFVILCQSPKRETDTYRGTYLEGTRNLIAALEGREPKKLIFISSTSVYGTADGSWVDEKTTACVGFFESKGSEENAKILIKTEKFVLASGMPSIVFRLGGIYGPGRHRLRVLKEGKMKPSFSGTYVNRIHVEDIVAGIELLMEKGKPGEIYLGVDDHPSTQKEFYEWVYERSGWPRPAANGTCSMVRVSNKRGSNAKLKALGWKPKYPSFREGYAPLLKEMF